MKRTTQIALSALLVFTLVACGSKEGEGVAPAQTPVSDSDQTTVASSTGLDAVPVSTANLGSFPFFNLPNGFMQGEVSDRALEQKFVFPDNGLLVIEGRYHHARIYPAEGGEWNQTLLLRSFDEKIKALGGVQMFDGGLPDAAREKISAESPRFASDLYDPNPYRFRQYLIRTPQGRVWIEIGYGYNADMADFTVVQEAELQQTITQITSDAIDRSLKADGKAILDIRFDTDRATLLPDGRNAVGQIAELLKNQPDLKVSIEGHTDDTGTATRNTVLSLERAEIVRTALLQAGIAAHRLKASGFGDSRPLASGTTDADRAKNRRVELVRF